MTDNTGTESMNCGSDSDGEGNLVIDEASSLVTVDDMPEEKNMVATSTAASCSDLHASMPMMDGELDKNVTVNRDEKDNVIHKGGEQDVRIHKGEEQGVVIHKGEGQGVTFGIENQDTIIVATEQNTTVSVGKLNVVSRGENQDVIVNVGKETDVIDCAVKEHVADCTEQHVVISGEQDEDIVASGGEQDVVHSGVGEIPVVDISMHFSTSIEPESASKFDSMQNAESSEIESYSCKDVSVRLVRISVTQEELELAAVYSAEEFGEIVSQPLPTCDDPDSLFSSTKIIQCYECFETFISINVVLEHGRTTHGKELSQEKLLEASRGCSICLRKFRHYDTLRKHFKICKRKASRKSSAMKRKYSDAFCSVVQEVNAFDMPGTKVPAMVDVRFPCAICDQIYKNKARLRTHLSVIHNTEPTEQLIRAVPSSSISFVKPTCKICNLVFARWDALHNHTKTNHKFAVIRHTTSGKTNALQKAGINFTELIAKDRRTCLKCSSSYASLSSLYRHIRIHHRASRSRPLHTCAVCGKEFSGQSQLRRHDKMLHQVENGKKARKGAGRKSALSYSCAICGKIFGKRKHAQRHVKDVHGYEDYNSKISNVAKSMVHSSPKCIHCSVTLSSWRTLYRHIESEHPEQRSGKKPTYCNLCEKTYKSNECWRKHTRRYHRDAYKSCKVRGKNDVKAEEPVTNSSTGDLVCQCHLCGTVIRQQFVRRHLSKVHHTKPSVISLKPKPADQIAHVAPVCVYCETTRSSWKSLYGHIREKHATLVKGKRGSFVTCKVCSLVFQDKFQLQFHNKYLHPESKSKPADSLQSVEDVEDLVFPCNTCGKVLSSLNVLENHMRNIHFVKGANFVVIEGVPKNMVEDTSPKCKSCGTSFKGWKMLYNHLKGNCGKDSDVKSGLSHCAECNMTFRTQYRLHLHSYHFHEGKMPGKIMLPSNVGKRVEVKEPPVPKEAQTAIICPLCDKEYLNETGWFRHLRVLHRLTETKAQAMQMELTQRTIKGSRIEPPDVTTTIEVPNELEESISEHSSAKFKCRKCDMTTDYFSSLRRHCKRSHNQKLRFSDTVKPRLLADSKPKRSNIKADSKPEHNIKADSKSEHSNIKNRRRASKPIKCAICPFTSLYKNNLVRHCMRVHQKTRKVANRLSRHAKFPKTVTGSANAEEPSTLVNNIFGEQSNSMGCTPALSDMSSSDSEWMHVATDVENSSSSDSSSDDSDEVAANTRNIQFTRRFSSSSSSSSSSSEDSMTEEIYNPFDVKHKSVSNISSPPHHQQGISNSTAAEEVLLLKGDDVLELDEDIFVTGGSSSGDEKDVGLGGVKSQPMLFGSKDLVDSAQQDTFPPRVNLHEADSSQDDVQVEETKSKKSSPLRRLESDYSLETNKYTGADSSLLEVAIGPGRDIGNISTLKKHLKITPGPSCDNQGSVFNLKNQREFFSGTGNVVAASGVCEGQSKNLPIAVLRPFSDVPDHDPGKSSDSQASLLRGSCNDMASNITNIAENRAFGSAITLPDNVHGANLSAAGTNDIGSLAKLSVSDVLYSGSQNSTRSPMGMSFPIFLVDSTDFILPCFVAESYAYRRISLALNNGRMLWYFNNWYEDLSLCRWGAIALLPKPLAYVDEIDWLIKWMLPNKIASLPFSSSRLPRLDYIDSSKPHMFTIVSSYGTIKCSAICCLCGFLLRDAEMMNLHGLRNHPLCTLCNKLKTVKEQHICDISKSAAATQVPLVKFVRLSDSSSVNCKLITMTSGIARASVTDHSSGSIPYDTSGQLETCKRRSNIGAIPVLEDHRHASLDLNIPLAKCHIANTATSAQQRESVNSGGLRIRTVRKKSMISLLQSKHDITKEECNVVVGPSDQHVAAASSASRQTSRTTHDLQSLLTDGDKNEHNAAAQLMEKAKKAVGKSETESLLQTYLREKSTPYHCKFCDMWFPLELQHSHHMTTLHKKCTLCDLVFKNRKERSNHITEFHGIFMCLACEKTCTSNDKVRSHIITDHININTGLFSCVRCGNKQIHPELIVKHLDEHDEAESKSCSKCQLKLSSNKRSILEHFFSHSLVSSRSYCLACDAMYIEPWALRKHLSQANHKRACKFCLFSSCKYRKKAKCGPSSAINQEVTAAARKWITQNMSQTSCNLCWKTFSATEKLREHCDKEHSECAIQCEVCGQRFQFDHQRAFHMGKHKKTVAHVYSLCAKCCKVECRVKATSKSQDTAAAGDIYQVVNSCSKYCKAYIDPDPVGAQSQSVHPRHSSDSLLKDEDSSESLSSIEVDDVINPGDSSIEVDDVTNPGDSSIEVDDVTNPGDSSEFEVQVSMEHIQVPDSGNVQLMLSGKLFNFVADNENGEISEEKPLTAGGESNSESTNNGSRSDNGRELPGLEAASCDGTYSNSIKDEHVQCLTADAAFSEEDLPIVVKLVGEDLDSDDSYDIDESSSANTRVVSAATPHSNTAERCDSSPDSIRDNIEITASFSLRKDKELSVFSNKKSVDLPITNSANDVKAPTESLLVESRRSYRCSHCTYSCNFRAALNKHMKMKHNDTAEEPQ